MFSTGPSLPIQEVFVGSPKVPHDFWLFVYLGDDNLRSAAGDGVFATTNSGYISLIDLKTNTSRNLVLVNDIKDVGYRTVSAELLIDYDTAGQREGHSINVDSWELSSDMKYMLIKSDYTKVRCAIQMCLRYRC